LTVLPRLPDTTRHYGGTGLGLSICKARRLQGGIIELESEPGIGSSQILTPFGIPEKLQAIADQGDVRTMLGLEGKRILVARIIK
jgi:hypothetical protein